MIKTFDYSNVYLVPKPSDINSRDEVDLSVHLPMDIDLDIPIIASPMKGITSPEIISGMANHGGIGIQHRFYDNEQEWEADNNQALAGMNDTFYFGNAVGLNDERYKKALDYGASIICVDVANGYLEKVKKFCEQVANHIQLYSYNALLMSGNVINFPGMLELAMSGVRLIRIGIGTGNLCTTREVTGIGYGQISAIQDCCWKKQEGVYLVADGGIRSSGDAIKALAAGANLVMLGSLLGKTYESSHNGLIYGMASRKLQDEYYHSVKSIEGIEKEMEKTVSLDEFLSEFTYGMKSAMTYVGARNIKELQEKAEFVEIG